MKNQIVITAVAVLVIFCSSNTKALSTSDPSCPYPSDHVTRYPFYGNCAVFWECYQGAKSLMKCPEGLEFNAPLEQCDTPKIANCDAYALAIDDNPDLTADDTLADETTTDIDFTSVTDATTIDTDTTITDIETTATDIDTPTTDTDITTTVTDTTTIKTDTTTIDSDTTTIATDTTTINTDTTTTDTDTTTINADTTTTNTDTTADTDSTTDIGSTTETDTTTNADTTTDTDITTDTDTTTTTYTTTTVSTTTGIAPPVCPLDDPNAVYFPVVGDCTKYWECFDGSWYLYNCPPGLWWHPVVENCDYPGSYCDDSITDYTTQPTNPTSDTTTSVTGSTAENDPRCSQGGTSYWPEPGECHRYIECIDEVSYLVNCPANTYFSDNVKECVPADESECCQVYECV